MCLLYFQLSTHGAIDTTSKEEYKQFTFDHSYWSVNPEDSHYTTQEKVNTRRDRDIIIMHGIDPSYHITTQVFKHFLKCDWYHGLITREAIGSHILLSTTAYSCKVCNSIVEMLHCLIYMT